MPFVAISAGGRWVVDRPWWGAGPALGMLPVVLQPCDDKHVIEGTGYPMTDIGIPRALYLIAGLLLLIWFALCWIIGTPSRLS